MHVGEKEVEIGLTLPPCAKKILLCCFEYFNHHIKNRHCYSQYDQNKIEKL